jgi:hypothetical protein
LELSPRAYDIDAATGLFMAHIQTPGKPGFTGAGAVDRIAAAGGTYAHVGEVISFSKQADCLSVLLNSVFHRSALLSTKMTAIGMGFVDLGPYGVCVFEPGYKVAAQTGQGWVGFYPTDEQSGVPVGMPTGEAPDPAPDVPNAIKGSPISIYFDTALKSVEVFTVTARGASTSVPTRLILKEKFPFYMTASEAHILPAQLFSGATTYDVVFKGTLASGRAVDRNWSFVTQ